MQVRLIIDYIIIFDSFTWNENFSLVCSNHSHKQQKDSLETPAVLLIFSRELEISGWPCRECIKTAKNGGFYEEMFSENNFEAVLVTFSCYDYGANASEAVQRITDQKEYHKCSSCVIIC